MTRNKGKQEAIWQVTSWNILEFGLMVSSTTSMWRRSRPAADFFWDYPKHDFNISMVPSNSKKCWIWVSETNIPKHIIWWQNANKNGNTEQHCKENACVREVFTKMRVNTWAHFYWNHKTTDAKMWRQKMVDGIEMKIDRLFSCLYVQTFY